MRQSIDTNILVYSIDSDAGVRHNVSARLLTGLFEQDCVVAVQAYAEFFHVVTRKGLLEPNEAAGIVRDWQMLFTTITAGPDALEQAMQWRQAGVLSFWDGMLIATAKRAGVQRLFSEDMNHQQRVGGLELWDPFAARMSSV